MLDLLFDKLHLPHRLFLWLIEFVGRTSARLIGLTLFELGVWLFMTGGFTFTFMGALLFVTGVIIVIESLRNVEPFEC